jgi:MinD superfamily P-loop ATPase
MMTIAVASGKGGAGKTSFAAALAASIGPGSIVADCDVDAANGAIALGGSINRREDYYAGPGYRIDASACTGCGACTGACRFEAIKPSSDGRSYRIVPELCERCGACVDRCIARAIGTFEKKAGELFVSHTRIGPALVHAELEPGEDTSGKLVRKVREGSIALARPDTVIVVDAPPGIGCPVIASLSGCDLVVVVVEASASGIKDAERLIELLDSMKRPAVGVINKAGLNAPMDTRAKAILERAGLPLAGEIPFDPALRSVEEGGKTWKDVKGAAGDSVRKALGAVKGAMAGIARKMDHGQEKERRT